MIRELYPTTKLLFVFFVICSVFIVNEYLFAYLASLACLLLAYAARVHWEFLKTVLQGLVTVCLFIFVVQSFFYPGETVLWSWAMFSIKQEGIRFSLQLTSKILAIGSSLVLFFRITPVKDFVYSLQALGLSPKVTYVVLATLNIIPEMKKLSLTIMDAQKSRGVETEGNVWVRSKAFLPIITPLILASVASTEERAITLESRAFTVPRKKTSYYRLEKTKKDTFARVVMLVLFMLIIGWGVFL